MCCSLEEIFIKRYINVCKWYIMAQDTERALNKLQEQGVKYKYVIKTLLVITRLPVHETGTLSLLITYLYKHIRMIFLWNPRYKLISNLRNQSLERVSLLPIRIYSIFTLLVKERKKERRRLPLHSNLAWSVSKAQNFLSISKLACICGPWIDHLQKTRQIDIR